MRPLRASRCHLVCCSLLALALVLPGAQAAGASPSACQVKNVSRGGTYSSLAVAVNKARNGNRLTVRGTCVGKTTITNKKLRVTGVWTKASGTPTLRGNGKGPVLYIGGDYADVTVRKLTIRGNSSQSLGYNGGGLFNVLARTTLENVTIKDFKTRKYGGGIALEEGVVRLTGTTSVFRNQADYGGGVYNNSGTVIVSGSSSVRNNTARGGGGIVTEGGLARLWLKWNGSVRNNRALSGAGGGLSAGYGGATLMGHASVTGNTAAAAAGGIDSAGTLTLAGYSAVTGNTAGEEGGGIRIGSKLTMSPASSVSGNTALYGGGVKSQSDSTLTGVVCAPATGANVFDNTPDDCHDL